MRYYKNQNNEIYAYEDYVDEKDIKDDLVKITKKEATEILSKLDEKYKLQEQINEVETHIRHAILIGNDGVLPELRNEYKELLTQKQALEKGGENEKEN